MKPLLASLFQLPPDSQSLNTSDSWYVDDVQATLFLYDEL